MRIVGHGIDNVDVERFEKLFQDGDSKYLVRYFTQMELEGIPQGADRISKLATRFAAKEAIMKSLKHGFGDGLAFTDIEIETGDDGSPTCILHGKANEIAEELGIREWWISYSYSGGVAVASAIACA